MMDFLIISTSSDVIRLLSEASSREVVIKSADSVKSALQIHNQTPYDLIVVDLDHLQPAASTLKFSEISLPFKKSNPLVQFVVITSKDTIREAIEAINDGARDYLTHPIDVNAFRMVFDLLNNTVNQNLELDYLRGRFWKTEWLEVVHTRNPIMRKVFENLRSVAPTIATVLLLGETGTGKGLLARLVHWHSRRSETPFIAVHCGAIPDTLVESELFGHEKGAFTGATHRKIGKFEMARSGTIFLDEIGTITEQAQIKLLQVLQDGTFGRVGGEEQLKTDARIIAASNADLKQLTEKGLFRRDLFYRLNTFPVQIPPLRDRLEDLPHLIDMFLKNLNAKYGKGIQKLHPSVYEGFKDYDWPGNIRELENILERAYILENTKTLSPQNFPIDLVKASEVLSNPWNKEDLSLSEARMIAMVDFERSYLKDLLKGCKGKINLSAKKAGITTRQLHRLLARHGIKKNQFKV
jgi:two-component system response regulator HydG